MQRTKWIERKFTFDYPAGWLPNILERLRGTSVRIKEMITEFSESDMEFKPSGKWSIKENIGHLIDLEDLHEGRLDDFIDGKQDLRAADMSNAKTLAANHNFRNSKELLNEFTERRRQFIAKLQNLSDDIQNSSALHPRLQVMMRPIDVAFFTAEHDDHHLADIREIIKIQNR